MNRKIVFIAKTNLNNDGRILNQIKILQARFANPEIDFILLPDKPLEINLGENVTVHIIQTAVRNKQFFRFLTVFEFTFRTLRLLMRLRPKVLHAHDTAVVLPVYLYQMLKGRKSFSLIYDDHEMPNEHESLQYRFFHLFERKLMRKADLIIFANGERKQILESSLNLNPVQTTYFLNLPYFESTEREYVSQGDTAASALVELDSIKTKGVKLIMHQGILEQERGAKELAAFSRILPDNIKIMLVGASLENYRVFTQENNININHFIHVGIVSYHDLNKYWQRADASIILYLPTFINNRLCAPNRLYISFLNSLPIIVNKSNPVLNNFILEHSCGTFIEELNDANINSIFDIRYDSSKIEGLKKREISKFENIYESLIKS